MKPKAWLVKFEYVPYLDVCSKPVWKKDKRLFFSRRQAEEWLYEVERRNIEYHRLYTL